MDLKKLDRLYGILVVTGMILVLLGVFVFDQLWIAMAGAVPACVAIGLEWTFAKCPYCGAGLSMRFGVPSRCPRCGKKLK